MHFAPTGPIVHRRTLSLLLVAALVAALLAVAAPSATAQNQPPLADAGTDAVYPVGITQRTLRGFRSFDIDNDVAELNFRWTVLTPSYAWLHLTHAGSPHGSEATFIAPSRNEVNRYGNTITFRLTVTDPQGASASDSVTYRFEGPPTAAIAVTALLPGPDAEDLDVDDCQGQDEGFSVNAVIAGPNQAGNSAIEWDINEGACLILRGIGTLAAGSTGQPQYFWQKVSAVPNRTEYNIPTRLRSRQSFSVLLPGDLEDNRVAIVHYTLTVTSPTGLQAQATVRIDVVDEPASPDVELELADDQQPVQDANALDPEAPTLRYVVEPGTSVDLVATASDDDGRQVRSLQHTWSGTGVAANANNRAGSTSRATITIPGDAPIGQTLTATVAVTDSTGLTGRDQIDFVVANNTPPEAIAPADFPAEDGPRGGTNNRGTVFVSGRGQDSDGGLLTYRWTQVDEDGVALKRPTVELINANSATVSFAAPQLPVNGQQEIHLALTVIDRWGVGDTDIVTITIVGRNDRPVAVAGPDQIVEPGAFVELDGTDSFDPDPRTRIQWTWAYTGFATSPTQSERQLTPYERNVVLLGFVPDGNDYSELDPLIGENTARPYFTAPQLGGLSSLQLTFTLTVEDSDGGRSSDTISITVTGQFFSGIIAGPDFCTNHSLGGPRTFAFDSDNDGVADVCSLPYTRREAIARQNALVTLVTLNRQRFRTAVLNTCDELTGDYGDSPESLDNDACETRVVADPPPPVDPALAQQFFSGIIAGPDFCTNLSLGGPRTFAFDSDNDGVADVCSLPYTRRVAIARQNALETFTTPQAVFGSALALACRGLGLAYFEGDTAAAMARDACA